MEARISHATECTTGRPLVEGILSLLALLFAFTCWGAAVIMLNTSQPTHETTCVTQTEWTGKADFKEEVCREVRTISRL